MRSELASTFICECQVNHTTVCCNCRPRLFERNAPQTRSIMNGSCEDIKTVHTMFGARFMRDLEDSVDASHSKKNDPFEG